MNLIDRDKLKDEWENNYLVRNEMVDHNNMIDCVIVSIDAQPIVNKWIPVSERLPEESGKYYVARDFWGEHIQYEVMRFHVPTNGWSTEHDNIIAWKPIEPYTGDKE